MLSLSSQAAVEPEKVEPSLVIVSHGFEYRILVYSVCSPEHCWSDTYLQSVSFGEETPTILCSKRVEEIAAGHTITNVTWSINGDIPQASLRAEASHGGFEPRDVIVHPKKGCEYEIAGVATTGF